MVHEYDPRSPLYSPAAADLARSLPDVGETLHAQLDELSARPTADGAEQLAINLEGARRAVLRLRERILIESTTTSIKD